MIWEARYCNDHELLRCALLKSVEFMDLYLKDRVSTAKGSLIYFDYDRFVLKFVIAETLKEIRFFEIFE